MVLLRDLVHGPIQLLFFLPDQQSGVDQGHMHCGTLCDS